MNGGDYAVCQVVSGETYAWTTCGGGIFDTELTLRQGEGCGGSVLAYNDDACGLNSSITWTATFTGLVSVLVSRYSCRNSNTSTTLRWACTSCAPSTCRDLIVGTSTYSQTGLTTAGSGDDFDSGDVCGSSYMNGDDYVIEYTPDLSGCVDIILSNTDTWVGVFLTDRCPSSGSATCLGQATDDDGNPSLTGMAVTAGQTYYITISTYPSPQSTPFDIDIVACPPPPANDECAQAIPLTVNNSNQCTHTSAGSLSSATASPQSNPCNGTPNDDVWYSFTATNATHVISLLNIAGSTSDLYISVFGGPCGALGTPILCSDPETATVNGLTVGQTYFVRVFSYFGAAERTTFDICVGIVGASDCIGGITVCSDDNFIGRGQGSGNTELDLSNRGCLISGEHQSNWYLFQAQSGGTLEFSIAPTRGDPDYDFAVWGPFPAGSQANTICVPNQQPIRCSYALPNSSTGLITGAGDNSEGENGDGWVNGINMNTGDVYILLVVNYATGNIAFELSFNLRNGAGLDCTTLPIELVGFGGRAMAAGNQLQWQTLSEINNDYFAVESGTDGVIFGELARIDGAGTSTETNNYAHLDRHPKGNPTYYRLRQTDFDGAYSYSEIVAVHRETKHEVTVYPNPTRGDLFIDASFRGERTYVLVDSRGREVLRKTSAEAGQTQLHPGDSNPAGIYLLRVLMNDETVQSQKIVFVR